MSAASAPAQSNLSKPATSAPAIAAADIDASCRWPLLFQFLCSALWLFVGTVLALIASVKMHSPSLLAEYPFLTYGRIFPAAMNAILYGFALQAGFGVALWIMARLGRAPLVGPGAIIVATIFWNFGVDLGLFGILRGDTTGFSWLEMPRYASPILFCAFAVWGVSGLLNFQRRNQTELYSSHWFLLAALFWFPWIYSTANGLLLCSPVRGVVQAIIGWWYVNNLFTIVLGFLGLGAIFYFIPKLVGRPLHSHYQAMFAFWALALFGSWMGVPPGSPVPAWLPAVSTATAVLTLVPIAAVALNCHQTLSGQYDKIRGDVPLRFIVVGLISLLAAVLMFVASANREVGAVTQFTWFTRAQTQLFLLGFFALTMFGAVYHIVQRLAPEGAACPRLTKFHFWAATIGVALLAVPLAVGGILEGRAMANPNLEFMVANKAGMMMLRLSTMGDLLIAAGAAMLLLNLVGVLVACCRACCKAGCADKHPKSEAAS